MEIRLKFKPIHTFTGYDSVGRAQGMPHIQSFLAGMRYRISHIRGAQSLVVFTANKVRGRGIAKTRWVGHVYQVPYEVVKALEAEGKTIEQVKVKHNYFWRIKCRGQS